MSRLDDTGAYRASQLGGVARVWYLVRHSLSGRVLALSGGAVVATALAIAVICGLTAKVEADRSLRAYVESSARAEASAVREALVGERFDELERRLGAL